MSSSSKKYQIFISSTFNDLVDERNEVMKHILSLYHIPIGMEMFSADNAEQWETIKDTIDSSDYYVLIVGHRYGSLDKTGMGYTEKEFNYAKSQGIPVLVFIREREVSIPEKKRDTDHKKLKKLAAFIESAKDNKLVSFWKEKEDLALQVLLAFQKASRKNDRIGWVRADSVLNTDGILEELTLLQKENREMRAELEGLRIERLPKFDIIINNDLPFTISRKATNWNSTDFITLNNPLFDKRHYPHIWGYNANVEANENLVLQYNEAKLKYLVCNTYVKFTLLVKNIGNYKASDINIKLEIPERLNAVAGSRDEVLPFQFEEKLNFKDMQMIKTLQPSGSTSFSNLLTHIPSHPWSNSGFEIHQNKKNTLDIRINNLIHTKEIQIGRIFIAAPDETFEDVIKLTLICEEIPDVITLDIPVSVSYEHNSSITKLSDW